MLNFKACLWFYNYQTTKVTLSVTKRHMTAQSGHRAASAADSLLHQGVQGLITACLLAGAFTAL